MVQMLAMRTAAISKTVTSPSAVATGFISMGVLATRKRVSSFAAPVEQMDVGVFMTQLSAIHTSAVMRRQTQAQITGQNSYRTHPCLSIVGPKAAVHRANSRVR